MMPLARVLQRAVALHGGMPALTDNGVRFTYGELASRVARLAGGLIARGLEPGDRIAVLARNSFRFFELNLACAHAGIVLIPLNIV
jgi:acyl-CoA synthetase (AMP-forming)/AMP-acid ligase II